MDYRTRDFYQRFGGEGILASLKDFPTENTFEDIDRYIESGKYKYKLKYINISIYISISISILIEILEKEMFERYEGRGIAYQY